MPIELRAVGGPTVLLEMAGVRVLTDPTFDPPGDHPIGTRVLTKTEGPALSESQVGNIDVVLLSHHQHPDNLDTAGRRFLGGVSSVLTTPSAAAVLGDPCRSMQSWESIEIHARDGATLHVMAVPARHGPPGTEHLTGEVTGFVLTSEGVPSVYVSGDNAGLDVVAGIAERTGGVDVAVLFAGAARTALLGDALLTLDSRMAVEAARLLGATAVVPAHFRGWGHFTEGADVLRAAFADAGLSEVLHLLEPGAATTLG
jgi:L-ascorbate metabolism protein UlaG (beta-lactamase superfamily)